MYHTANLQMQPTSNAESNLETLPTKSTEEAKSTDKVNPPTNSSEPETVPSHTTCPTMVYTGRNPLIKTATPTQTTLARYVRKDPPPSGEPVPQTPLSTTTEADANIGCTLGSPSSAPVLALTLAIALALLTNK